jgi:hypothetical protein
MQGVSQNMNFGLSPVDKFPIHPDRAISVSKRHFLSPVCWPLNHKRGVVGNYKGLTSICVV